MFKKVLVAVASMVMIAVGVLADTATVNGIEWTYTVSNGKASIYNNDYDSAIPETTTGAITIPSSLGGYPVTSIGNFAFEYCSGLTSITIPDSVTSIGEFAFWSCDGLTSVTIPNSVTSIGDYAFLYCSGLTSVTIPNSITSIGNGVFSGCNKLVEVINKSSLSISKGSSSYGYVAYYALDVHSGESKIVNYNDYLFYTSEGVNYLLGYVGTATALTLPNNYKGENYKIYNYAFYGCRGLTSVTIPDSVTSIGDYAFSFCIGLESFIVDSNNPSYKSVNGLLLSKDGKKLIAGVNGDVVIPQGVTSIGDYAFRGCSGLTSITIPNSVTSIGEEAFSYCSRLTSVTIPNSVMSIGDSAFWNCDGLTSVAIPDSVTSIGDWAFRGCSNLKSAIFLGDAPRNVGDYIFDDCADDFTIKVKKGTKGWNGDYTSTALPTTWHGYPIAYDSVDDLYPVLDANATVVDVANALGGSVDTNLAKNITSVEMYSNYKEWAFSVKTPSGEEMAGVEAVMASPNAWLSFALDSDVLIAKAPVDGDVVIDSFEKDSSSGLFEFTVNIKDIGVGNDAIEENLRKVFDIEGTSNLSADFSADSVDISVVAPDNGKVKFSVAPIDKSKRSFFFRVKMK